MRLRRMEVTNFRALRNTTIRFGETTALIGENNCGKSAFLLALDLFFSNSPRVKEKDFSDGNIQSAIDVTISFGDLTPAELSEFAANLLGDELIVTRRLTLDPKENGKFFVSAKVNPDFSDCRNEDGKTEKREKYKKLQENYDLPNVKAADEIDGHLEAWESANADKLKIERVAGFKGWKNVAIGKLKGKTDYVFIRAVQDASEDIQADKNSPVLNLINTIARQTIENNSEFRKFIEQASAKVAELTDPNNVPVLSDISERMTLILERYYKSSGIAATWSPVTNISPNFPTANIEVTDNNFTTSIDGVGHGLQRAIILTVLQFMTEHRARGEAKEIFSEAQSDVILAIEEPEIYQHPTKQRLFAKLLAGLAQKFNEETGIRVQVVYVTHSPLMLSLTECEAIRMVRHKSSDSSRNVSVSEISLANCAKISAAMSGRPQEEAWSPAQYGAKLHTFRSELAEGFFGKCVVLVEGVGDRAVLEAWYRLSGRDPHAEGIVIVDVTGKNNLDKPIVIFSALDIPTYWIFDNDKSEGPPKSGSLQANKILQRLAGYDADVCEDWPEGVFEKFSVWDFNLEKYIEVEVGEGRYNAARLEASTNFDIDQDMCLKFPASASAILLRLREDGHEFKKLDEIVSAIDKLMVADS